MRDRQLLALCIRKVGLKSWWGRLVEVERVPLIRRAKPDLSEWNLLYAYFARVTLL